MSTLTGTADIDCFYAEPVHRRVRGKPNRTLLELDNERVSKQVSLLGLETRTRQWTVFSPL